MADTQNHVRRPMGANLNTVLQLITLASVIYGGIYIWVNTSRDIDDLKSWRMDVKSVEARNEDRFKSIETDARKTSAAHDALQFRVSSVEQQASGLSQSLKEIQFAVNAQSGDLRVIKEILQRLEAVQKQGR